MEHITRNQELKKLFFRTFFLINFNSTALFKNAFLGLDLAGRPFGGDFEQLSPRKMKKGMVPIATLVNCLSTGTKDHSGAFHREPKKLIFRTFFLDQFQ